LLLKKGCQTIRLVSLSDKELRCINKSVSVLSRSSHKQNLADIPLIIERDGDGCVYCPEQFTPTHPREWEHLNNDHDENAIWNKAFSHHECNNKKKLNTDMQMFANEKIESNKKYVYKGERTLADTGTTEELTSCQAISKINFRIAEQYLTEHTVVDGDILLIDAVKDITGICKKNNDTGSQQAVRRYIDILTSSAYPFTLSLNAKGQTIIRRRTEN